MARETKLNTYCLATMKKDIAKAFADKYDLPQSFVKEVIVSIHIAIRKALMDGKRVRIEGVGMFKAIQRNARTGRNPRTGQAVQISPKRGVRFRISNELYKAMNNSDKNINHSEKDNIEDKIEDYKF